jgi:hypothetical protein
MELAESACRKGLVAMVCTCVLGRTGYDCGSRNCAGQRDVAARRTLVAQPANPHASAEEMLCRDRVAVITKL